LSGKENGELLSTAAQAGFNALITNDRGLEYEQDQRTLPLAVIVLQPPTNTIEDIRPLLPALHSALSALVPRVLVKIEG
jgi:hypothetical protein